MKAVVIIDMPTECVECPLCSDGHCDVQGKYLDDVFNQIDECCPLRPLPRKAELENCSSGLMGMIDTGFRAGWNECLKEITK